MTVETRYRETVKLGVLLVVTGVALPVCAQSPASPASPAVEVALGEGADAVVATIDGEDIRMRDLEEHWQTVDAASFTRMRQQIYEANRRVLDDLIGERLLAAEAERRGLPPDELLEQEIAARIQPVTEARILEVYNQSQEREQGITLEQLRPAIVAFLEQQQPQEARFAYLNELRAAAGAVSIRLAVPRAVIELADGDPALGPDDAPVQIVEFSDFQCPFCRQLAPVLKDVAAKYGDQVRVVWKDFPLPGHPDAVPAAVAARCAHDQGEFWAYHDQLFGNQSELTPDNFKRWATDLGMDGSSFGECFDSGVHRSVVEAGMQLGSRYGVSSTPTVYINGRLIVGAMPFESYDEVVQEELAARP